ncbi:alpha/beta-hydrolase [Xylona heveae TC161]|uniref:Alpha/beta-hydrolase n=1 Tax=Xylona heveae (strain CBS 132557 / TC161) TaxID=1328760 RepID=A0A165IEY2_XYLHT|nr:alpha/beta-hydrolase [Xylona heveae TC161]KZF24800.1 alpha/beta-hydrolase [Xylona heveae TC161]
MPFDSDLSIDASRFHPESVSDETRKINAFLTDITIRSPRWYEVGIVKYRQMHEAGETPLPAPVYLPEAEDATVPSRDADRLIPLRVYRPDNGAPSQGLLLHFHGGGFVLASHKHFDSTLQMYANRCQVIAISVGYRLAPENPYPAGMYDCLDAAEYLIDHGEEEHGAPLRFLAGESAGGCLAALTAFHLMRSRASHRLAGVILPYGEFDVSLSLPKVMSFTEPLMINFAALQRFNDAYAPGMSTAGRKHPRVSPLYEDMQALAAASPHQSLPPALFLCGTEDPLLDDTLLMSAKWIIANGEAVVRVFSGAPHGFTLLAGTRMAEEAAELIVQFVQEKLAAAVAY